MGKLVIKFQGKVVDEVDLKLGETKIGRKPSCDVVLSDALVSAEHAVVKTVGVKSFIQDLGSTNGTFVENNRVQLHELRNGETIVIGGHSLIYRDALNLDAPVFGRRPAASAAPSAAQRTTTIIAPFAHLLALDGSDKGKRVSLVKDSVTLENPGKSPARIGRTADGDYVLEAQIGPGEPRLNGKPVPPGGQLLEEGDIIEVAGTKLKFSR
jgi:predicted component of type VI protein secretion system